MNAAIELVAMPRTAIDTGGAHKLGFNKQSIPMHIEAASTWADRDPPPPRDCVIEDLAIYAGRVVLMTGHGGIGKTNMALQMLIASAANRRLYGCEVRGGCALGLFCEDEQSELERRVRAICAGDGIALSSLDRLHIRSLDGEDNILCTYNRDQIVLTDRYWELDATFEAIRPRIAVLDTAADLFAGDFMSTPHVRQFIKVALACTIHEGRDFGAQGAEYCDVEA